jgi:hypothetical protein
MRQPNLELFFCKREFLHEGVRSSCDSADRNDGEHLRPLFEPVPESLALLNTYQKTREQAKLAAYLGTAGLVIAIVGPMLAGLLKGPNNGPLTEAGLYLSTAASLGGITLAGGAIVIGLTVIRANENRLFQAVQNYNQVHPEKPVDLLFSTGVKF